MLVLVSSHDISKTKWFQSYVLHLALSALFKGTSRCWHSYHVLHFNEHNEGHFTHETESPWPLHSKRSHWWKTRSWSKFASHYAWGTNWVYECKMDGKSTWIPTWHPMDRVSRWLLDYFQKPPLEGRPTTKSGDHGTLYTHNCWFILFWSCVRTRMNRNSLK